MKKRKSVDDFFDNINSVVSYTECTGLIQIPPENDDEMESYQQIYAINERKIVANKKR